MAADPKSEYRKIVDEAVDDLAEHGFDNAERVAHWEARIRRAAEAAMGPSARMEEMLREVLRAAYEKIIAAGGVTKYHPGIARWTVERVKPALRAELDKRILASANLIRLKRKQRVDETLARFSGWATSIPAGGSAESSRREEKARVKKPLASLPFEERRVLIDQGHKLTSAVNEVVATGGGAVAAVWHSRWRQSGYDYREDHKDRDLKVYLLRGSDGSKNWAEEKGLVKAGPAGRTDEITKPAEEPFCRCSYVYVYSLRELERVAPDMLTAKGREALEAARSEINKSRQPA